MKLPLIGVTGRRWSASRLSAYVPSSFFDAEFDLHFTEYTSAITRAGGIPVQLTRDAPIKECLERLDGVIVSGGADIDPSFYGDLPSEHLGVTEPERDRWELAIIEEALRADIPVLGICRGAQLLHVQLGGKLNQHVGIDDGDRHPQFDQPRNSRTHSVRFVEGTLAQSLYGDQASVNSLHHQTLQEPVSGLVVSGRSPDGTIEAVEVPNKQAFAVQWHPESLVDHIDPSLAWLVRSASKRTRA
jgi:putative glutamine amidotransferase